MLVGDRRWNWESVMVSDWRRPGREAKEKGRGRRELELAEGRLLLLPF